MAVITIAAEKGARMSRRRNVAWSLARAGKLVHTEPHV